MKEKPLHPLNTDEFIILQGYFFIKAQAIKVNNDLIKQTFKDFPKMLNKN